MVKSVLRTNFYSEDRYALSLRVKPNIMVSSPAAVEPYGVFFIHGRHFNAFHCRYTSVDRFFSGGSVEEGILCINSFISFSSNVCANVFDRI